MQEVHYVSVHEFVTMNIIKNGTTSLVLFNFSAETVKGYFYAFKNIHICRVTPISSDVPPLANWRGSANNNLYRNTDYL